MSTNKTKIAIYSLVDIPQIFKDLSHNSDFETVECHSKEQVSEAFSASTQGIILFSINNKTELGRLVEICRIFEGPIRQGQIKVSGFNNSNLEKDNSFLTRSGVHELFGRELKAKALDIKLSNMIKNLQTKKQVRQNQSSLVAPKHEETSFDEENVQSAIDQLIADSQKQKTDFAKSTPPQRKPLGRLISKESSSPKSDIKEEDIQFAIDQLINAPRSDISEKSNFHLADGPVIKKLDINVSMARLDSTSYIDVELNDIIDKVIVVTLPSGNDFATGQIVHKKIRCSYNLKLLEFDIEGLITDYFDDGGSKDICNIALISDEDLNLKELTTLFELRQQNITNFFLKSKGIT